MGIAWGQLRTFVALGTVCSALGCASTTPRQRRADETLQIARAPDAVYAAAREELAAEEYQFIVEDPQTRLITAVNVKPTLFSWWSQVGLWVRPAGAGSQIRMKVMGSTGEETGNDRVREFGNRLSARLAGPASGGSP